MLNSGINWCPLPYPAHLVPQLRYSPLSTPKNHISHTFEKLTALRVNAINMIQKEVVKMWPGDGSTETPEEEEGPDEKKRHRQRDGSGQTLTDMYNEILEVRLKLHGSTSRCVQSMN